jgi:hypothetical protein
MVPGAFDNPHKAHINVDATNTEDSTKTPHIHFKQHQNEKTTETNIIRY